MLTIQKATHRLGTYKKNPWNVHAPLLLFLYPESISALFIYSVIDRGAKCWTTLRDQLRSDQVFYHPSFTSAGRQCIFPQCQNEFLKAL